MFIQRGGEGNCPAPVNCELQRPHWPASHCRRPPNLNSPGCSVGSLGESGDCWERGVQWLSGGGRAAEAPAKSLASRVAAVAGQSLPRTWARISYGTSRRGRRRQDGGLIVQPPSSPSNIWMSPYTHDRQDDANDELRQDNHARWLLSWLAPSAPFLPSPPTAMTLTRVRLRDDKVPLRTLRMNSHRALHTIRPPEVRPSLPC